MAELPLQTYGGFLLRKLARFPSDLMVTRDQITPLKSQQYDLCNNNPSKKSKCKMVGLKWHLFSFDGGHHSCNGKPSCWLLSKSLGRWQGFFNRLEINSVPYVEEESALPLHLSNDGLLTQGETLLVSKDFCNSFSLFLFLLDNSLS